MKIKFQYLLPKQIITHLIGWVADQEFGWFTQLFIKTFIKYYKVNMKEALYPNPEHYKTFNDFFIRQLRYGIRPVTENPDHLVSPVDGIISQLGKIKQGKIIQAKKHDYSLESLLAGNYFLAEEFKDGHFATIYLSPRDYHRVHMPCNGILQEMIYVPGELFSVNLLMISNIPNLFARNERLICIFKTDFGLMAQILVGATIVGSIKTAWSGTVNITREGIVKRWTYPSTGTGVIMLKKGEEMGYFKLGSTIINLFTANHIQFTPNFISGFKIIMGGDFAQRATLTQTKG
ncbi:archaetidylserine decarboxylase [Candidatus Profftia sp. (ex Adelges kitamiensis)]|uniref:archaetidylserine decarboxylase n=1 Tax=Candidatus Profftia sp. (ex Adelges kitamiensis) TaxID=2864218 RepID=UPI001CE347B1|nr:archaetidylserine decarboxylase [Candidatus Profftia sp. (ex Adelges kitamiensis)]